MNRLPVILGIVAVLAATGARAADPAAGKAKYEGTCIACHGANGISIAPIYPNVAGQKDEYVSAQLKAFRDGVRNNNIHMTGVAAKLNDREIAAVSDYIAGLR